MVSKKKFEQVVVLKSKFDLEDRRVFFGVARLIPDRIVLKGLFYKRIIELDQIREVRWSSQLIVLGLFSGEELELVIQSPALWKFELQARCGLKDSINTFEKVKISTDSDRKITEDEISLSANLATEDGVTPKPVPTRESTYRLKPGFTPDRPKSGN